MLSKSASRGWQLGGDPGTPPPRGGGVLLVDFFWWLAKWLASGPPPGMAKSWTQARRNHAVLGSQNLKKNPFGSSRHMFDLVWPEISQGLWSLVSEIMWNIEKYIFFVCRIRIFSFFFRFFPFTLHNHKDMTPPPRLEDTFSEIWRFPLIFFIYLDFVKRLTPPQLWTPFLVRPICPTTLNFWRKVQNKELVSPPFL